MDQEQLQQKIAEYYAKLPNGVQTVFSSMKWLESLESLSTKYNLNESQKSTLGTETMLVLLGIIHLVEYENVLEKELEMPKVQFDKMLIEIDESILRTIRPQLSEAFKKNNEVIEEKVQKEEEKKVEEDWADNVNFIVNNRGNEK